MVIGSPDADFQKLWPALMLPVRLWMSEPWPEGRVWALPGFRMHDGYVQRHERWLRRQSRRSEAAHRRCGSGVWIGATEKMPRRTGNVDAEEAAGLNPIPPKSNRNAGNATSTSTSIAPSLPVGVRIKYATLTSMPGFYKTVS